MSTKPFLLTYVKRETDIRKKNWLSGHRLFANRPADRVRSLAFRQTFDSGRQHPSEKTDGGQIGSVDTGLKDSVAVIADSLGTHQAKYIFCMPHTLVLVWPVLM